MNPLSLHMIRCLFLFLSLISSQGLCQTPGDVRVEAGDFYAEPPTFHSLGFQWNLRGDSDRDARVAVAYRKAGAAEWREAMDLLRIRGEAVGVLDEAKAYTCGNLFAGSVLFLDPGTAYEVSLTLSDPDNGAEPVAVKTLALSTKAEPKPDPAGRVIDLRPGDDVARAVAEAQPGDQVVLHAGQYRGTFRLLAKGTREKPVTLRAAGDGEVVFQPDRDGGGIKVVTEPIKGTDQTHWHLAAPCFEAGGSEFLWIEGLTFRNYDHGIHAADNAPVSGLTVRHCRFEDSGWAGILLRSPLSRDLWIADNVFIGTQGTWHRDEQKPWPYKGVWVCGQGVDVCHNLAQNHKDGISVYGKSSPTDDFARKVCAIDFYRNDVGQSWDDNEADDAQHNVRFFENRFVDQHVGLSAQPVYGGPCYFVRNVQYNITRGVVFKLNVQPAGVLMYHNTSFCSGGAVASISRAFTNCHLFNNLFYGVSGPTLSGGPADEISRLDHNGFTWTEPIEWSQFDAKKGRAVSRRHESLEAFAAKTGQGAHNVLVEWEHLADVPKPPGEAKTHRDLNFGDARLKPGTPAVNAGLRLPNINDGFAGKAPDLGAFELGTDIPAYGPRARK